MTVYFNGNFIPKENVKISPDDRGFLFADGAYEVICSYHGKLFRVEDHIKRMERSLRELKIIRPERLNYREVAEKLIQINNLIKEISLIYFQVTRGVMPRKHSFSGQKMSPTVYACASPFEFPKEKINKGARIILVPDIRWTRCDIKSIALLPNVLAQTEAKDKGAYEAVFVRDGKITEGSHTNIFAVFDGQLRTYPSSNYVLSGITRKVIFEFAKKLQIPVKENPISTEDLKKADEVIIVGTTSEIMPVIWINNWKVGNGIPGPITRKLQQEFYKII